MYVAACLIQFIHVMHPILKLRSHALLSLVSVRLSSRLAPIVEAAPHLPLANNLFEEDKQVRNFGPEAGSIQPGLGKKIQKNIKSFRSFGWGTDSTSLAGQGCKPVLCIYSL